MFLETSRGKYDGFILALGVTNLLRSLEAMRGHKLPQCVVIVVVVVYIWNHHTLWWFDMLVWVFISICVCVCVVFVFVFKLVCVFVLVFVFVFNLVCVLVLVFVFVFYLVCVSEGIWFSHGLTNSFWEKVWCNTLVTNLGTTFKAPTNLGTLAPGLFLECDLISPIDKRPNLTRGTVEPAPRHLWLGATSF